MISTLAMLAKKTIEAAWFSSPAYDLATLAAEALEAEGLLQAPGAGDALARADAEYERLRVALESAKRGRRELRTRVAELEDAAATMYRAEHPDSGIVLGTYSNREAAVAHCEALARREGSTGLVSWVPDDGDALSPEELTFFDVEYSDGDDVPVQTCTGYVVTPLEVAAAYDPEADE